MSRGHYHMQSICQTDPEFCQSLAQSYIQAGGDEWQWDCLPLKSSQGFDQIICCHSVSFRRPALFIKAGDGYLSRHSGTQPQKSSSLLPLLRSPPQISLSVFLFSFPFSDVEHKSSIPPPGSSPSIPPSNPSLPPYILSQSNPQIPPGFSFCVRLQLLSR